MITELALDRFADLSDRLAERGILEFGHHGASSEPAKVAALRAERYRWNISSASSAKSEPFRMSWEIATAWAAESTRMWRAQTCSSVGGWSAASASVNLSRRMVFLYTSRRTASLTPKVLN
ncbi:MAG: hypothetical protein M0C28_29810 [Candidatus Moduliflexus flocculans]|nr:hypothetical protein [Candidatus Moduliflexus flocculans]